MNKIILLILPILLLSASCNPFRKVTNGGAVKTVNGGADWQFANAIKDNKNASLASLNIARLGFDPHNREIVFAGAYNGGLYKSEDSGGSWKIILSKILVYDFAVHPFDSRTIYVAGSFNNHGKVLKTTDGGASWNEIYNEASEQNPVRAIAVNPASPNQIVVGTGSGSLVKSADSGQSWKLANNFKDRTNRIIWQNNNLYVLSRNKGLAKSADFGDNFQSLTSNLAQSFGSLSSSNLSGTADVFNQFYVDPANANLVYLTTTKGLYKSTDEGKNWVLLALPVRPGESEAKSVAVAPTSSNIVFTNVAATIYKSLDGGQTFQTQEIATNGYINYILIDPQLPQIAYAGIYVAR